MSSRDLQNDASASGRTTDTGPPFPFTGLACLCVLRPAVGRPCPGKPVPFGWPQNEDTWNNLKSGVPVSQVSPAKIVHSHPRAQISAEGLAKKIKLEGALFSQDREPQFLWESCAWQETTEAGMLSSAGVCRTRRRRILFAPSTGLLTTSRIKAQLLPGLSRVW